MAWCDCTTVETHEDGCTTSPLIGALTLPPALLVLLIVAQHIPEWLKERYAWYIQSFNIANYTLDAFLARKVFELADARSSQLWVAVAALAACTVFTLTNHALLAVMLRLARGLGIRASGLFQGETIAIDFILSCLAPALVMLWHSNPWLVPAALAPLLLVHRSFAIPALQEEVRHDPKTGLYNARAFSSEAMTVSRSVTDSMPRYAPAVSTTSRW